MGKKLFSLFLVGILMIHLAGFYVYFVVRLGEIRMSMREELARLPSDQLEILEIPIDEFRNAWMEEREMEWGGKMYDIARVEVAGQFIVVSCKEDKDEENLLNFLSAVVAMTAEDSSQAPDSVTQFMTLEFVVVEEDYPLLPSEETALSATGYLLSPFQITPTPATPPPRA